MYFKTLKALDLLARYPSFILSHFFSLSTICCQSASKDIWMKHFFKTGEKTGTPAQLKIIFQSSSLLPFFFLQAFEP